MSAAMIDGASGFSPSILSQSINLLPSVTAIVFVSASVNVIGVVFILSRIPSALLFTSIRVALSSDFSAVITAFPSAYSSSNPVGAPAKALTVPPSVLLAAAVKVYLGNTFCFIFAT